ncbi:alginate O-acetyltransferase AlgX-related protein [Marinibacterium sp. SX1]|uniref:alginate O-acetyltransferase AlgX-related protein n=1 Tax=Marinibacterium sp. SX1 TaxID=3388424 RepID=UPI003D17E3C3
MTGKTLRKGRGRRGGAGLAALLAAAMGLGAGAGAARADDGYGCGDILTAGAQASVEGAGGMFFRFGPDLSSYHWIGDQGIDQLARLSARLAEQGTRLIYVPVPSKSLTMPDRVPPSAVRMGYDPEIAASVYGEMLRRLDEAGVTAIDARLALRQQALRGADPVFQADPRLTPDGAEALALAIAAQIRALPVMADSADEDWQVTRRGEIVLPSAMRMRLQSSCVAELPDVRLPIIEATRGGVLLPAAIGTGHGTGHGTANSPLGQAAPVVVVGTEIAVDPALGLASFLAAEARMGVAAAMVPGEDRLADAFGAISSYMGSAAFAAERPRVLVWANPVWLNLGRHGARPMDELITLAGAPATCGLNLPLSQARDGNVYAELSGPVRHGALLLDTGGRALDRVEFRFTSVRGETRARIVERHPRQAPTARVAMPLSGLWPEGAARVDIVTDGPIGGQPRLTLCEEI